MMDTDAQLRVIARVLDTMHTVAVVGLSAKQHRDSFSVARYMQAHGWRIVPVNPLETEILGETCYPSLQAAAKQVTIELVNVFRNSADVPPVVDAAIEIGAQAVWLQLGVWHMAATARAEAANLLVVQDKCLKIEHVRRMAGKTSGSASATMRT